MDELTAQRRVVERQPQRRTAAPLPGPGPAPADRRRRRHQCPTGPRSPPARSNGKAFDQLWPRDAGPGRWDPGDGDTTVRRAAPGRRRRPGAGQNALKFSDDQNPVHVHVPRRVRAGPRGRRPGGGLPAPEQQHLFQRFPVAGAGRSPRRALAWLAVTAGGRGGPRRPRRDRLRRGPGRGWSSGSRRTPRSPDPDFSDLLRRTSPVPRLPEHGVSPCPPPASPSSSPGFPALRCRRLGHRRRRPGRRHPPVARPGRPTRRRAPPPPGSAGSSGCPARSCLPTTTPERSSGTSTGACSPTPSRPAGQADMKGLRRRPTLVRSTPWQTVKVRAGQWAGRGAGRGPPRPATRATYPIVIYLATLFRHGAPPAIPDRLTG